MRVAIPSICSAKPLPTALAMIGNTRADRSPLGCIFSEAVKSVPPGLPGPSSTVIVPITSDVSIVTAMRDGSSASWVRAVPSYALPAAITVKW